MSQNQTFLRLWTAVLIQAIRDVETGDKEEQNSALAWMFGGIPSGRVSFAAVCSWLEIDPDQVRAALLRRRRFAFCYNRWREATRERIAA
ncbi:hypothetical protein [Sulfuricystis multivorans]|uniref:hypothetical protein n=1 Tax=Sulfuricystis multivorans TaxID=2211108 RepID=UPI001558F0D8|nr:hypothetical protein [Sulfuricystis multivorans]